MLKQQEKEKQRPEAEAVNTSAKLTADELDAIGAKFTRKEAWHEPQKAPETPPVEYDHSMCDQPELVPDGKFNGKWNLLVSVDFDNDKGKSVHIDAGIINGSDLPEAFAESLANTGKLVKA